MFDNVLSGQYNTCGWRTHPWYQTLLTCLRRQESSCNYWFWHSPQTVKEEMWKSWCSTMTEAVFNKEKAIGVISGTKDCKGKILSFNFVRGCSQMTAFFGVSDTPWCLCQSIISFWHAPWCFKSTTSFVNRPEPRTIIFRIQFISIRVNKICVTYVQSTIHLHRKGPTKSFFG